MTDSQSLIAFVRRFVCWLGEHRWPTGDCGDPRYCSRCGRRAISS